MNTEQHLNELAADQFMQPVIYQGRFICAETDFGTEYIEANLVGTYDCLQDYLEGEYISHTIIHGFGAYLSAPGYMDRTDLCVFDTESDAIDYLIEYYSD